MVLEAKIGAAVRDSEYAMVTRLGDGTLSAMSKACETAGEAERELAWMLGDDFYRDRHPFIGVRRKVTPWMPAVHRTVGCETVIGSSSVTAPSP